MAENYFQKAIVLFRNNSAKEEAEQTHKRLVEIQKEIPNLMIPVTIEVKTKDVIDTININMEGLTFEESILRLTQMVNFDKYEDIKTRVIEKNLKYPLSHLFATKQLDAYGQTNFVLPPLNFQNPEKNQELLEGHMHQEMLRRQELIGEIYIKDTLALIRDKFEINNSMVEFLVKGNIIIPEGRYRIFQSAIGMFLRGEYYEAMHIMAPQTENLFRNIAKEAGALTVTLKDDGSSKEKVLKSIFNLPELLECYDNDILFIFKGLLNEQTGANIRNKIGHGIIEEQACSLGPSLYFGVALIKLLSFTSLSCHEIWKNSERLKHFEVPSADSSEIDRNYN